MTGRAATVFVVDDDSAVRNSLRELFESVPLPVEIFASGAELLAAVGPERAGCLLLDVRLKDENGLDFQEELQRRGMLLPIIVLTGHGDVPGSVRAFKAGAFDFLQKPTPSAVLLETVAKAIAADTLARSAEASRADAEARLASLTRREAEVLHMLVSGSTSKEVAFDLRISVRTVEGHRRRVLSKFHVTSATQLVRLVLCAQGKLS
jgi:two-component system response regulator FixJ